MKLRHVDSSLEITEGYWVAKSLDGVEKRFKTADTAGRDAWEKAYANPQPDLSQKLSAMTDPGQPDLDRVWQKIEQIIGNIFPDGDPIDWVAPWIKKTYRVEDYKVGDIINAAAQKHGYPDMYAYWDELKREHGDDQLNEISNELLQKYKQAAALDAGAADKVAFDPTTDRETANQKMAHANKRFSGIMKATKKQFANDDKKRMEEGSMGGINRSAPAQDVSYEKVLDDQDVADQPIAYHLVDGQTNEVIGKYKPEHRGRARARRDKLDNQHGSYRYKVVPVYADEQLTDGREYYQNQLTQQYIVVDINTGETVAGPYADKQVAISRRDKLDLKRGSIGYRVEPLRKMVGRSLKEKDPCWKGYKQIGMKDKDGREVPNCVPVEENSKKDKYDRILKDILTRQSAGAAGKPASAATGTAPGTPKTESYEYHGYTIRTRDNGNASVDWAVIKDDSVLHKSNSATIEQAKMDAERFVQGIQGKGTASKNSSVIDFNSAFAKEFAPNGETFYVLFHRDPETNGRFIIISPTKLEHSTKSSIRAGSNFPGAGLTPKENRVVQLVPHGRYSIDTSRPDPIDEVPGAVMFPIILQGEAYDKNERVHMKEPGFTVGSPR